jgi:uncharacterized protein (DUF58 family)
MSTTTDVPTAAQESVPQPAPSTSVRPLDRIRSGLRSVATVLAALGRLIGRVLAPVLGVVAPAGRIALVLGFATLIAGFVLGWQELTYVSFTLLAAVAFSAVFLAGRTTYSVAIELTPTRVVAGERALGRMTVTNSGAKALPASRMELPVAKALAEFAIPALRPEEEHEELFAVPTARRAVIVAGPAVSVRGDQLGLLRREVRWTEPVELFVHPVTIPLSPSAAGVVRDLEGQVTKVITNSDLAFHALRPYEPGDDKRYIHWRTSARTGTLMVRQFEETRRSQLTILQPESATWWASEGEFELGVSVMASLATQVIRDGTQMNVVTDRRRLRTMAPGLVLDDSCRLELTQVRRSVGAREFARRATRQLPPPSVLMVIAGSKMTTTEFRSIQLLFPSDTTTMAFRIEPGAAPSLAPIGALRVATIGSLEDLPKVIRRAAS